MRLKLVHRYILHESNFRGGGKRLLAHKLEGREKRGSKTVLDVPDGEAVHLTPTYIVYILYAMIIEIPRKK